MPRRLNIGPFGKGIKGLDFQEYALNALNRIEKWSYDVLTRFDTDFLIIASPPLSLTIASGVVEVSRSYHVVDTESAAASDDLATINGGTDGMRLVIRAADDGRTVVVKDGTGNIQCTGDFSLNNTQDTIELIYDATLSAWLELGRTDSGA
jgi:hypothetical protein